MTESLSFELNRPLKDLCTIGIGGPAKCYIEAHTVEEMQAILAYCFANRLRPFILGKGSNTLFDDKGFDGVVIHNKISFLKDDGQGMFHVGAGYSFSRLGTLTARQNWSGLEFASGIPGSVGGAVYMNAGANGRETEETLVSVDFVTLQGELQTLQKDALHFSYRHSSFHSMQGAIVGAVFTLCPSKDARKTQCSIIDYRKTTQPYSEKSAGCMFRNPTNSPAGALIETSGLKGLKQGDAEVSHLHGNFLINKGNASASDVLCLVRRIQSTIRSKYNIELESEVRYIPYRDETISS
jgi:UDP-N-acetylmuramate dehydrogenase